MTKLSELKPELSEIVIPKISADVIKLQWYSVFYDGPINGMLEINGVRHWYA